MFNSFNDQLESRSIYHSSCFVSVLPVLYMYFIFSTWRHL